VSGRTLRNHQLKDRAIVVVGSLSVGTIAGVRMNVRIQAFAAQQNRHQTRRPEIGTFPVAIFRTKELAVDQRTLTGWNPFA
jgi:hypothetical protein